MKKNYLLFNRKQNFCHSEDYEKYYEIKRFFAEYKFPFAGSCVRPAQNDGKILVPQCLSNLVPFCSLAPCGRGQGEGLNPCKKKAAFTLAEVLITLGIIGVVAAMTIPNLIAEQQKRTTVTKLQRAISVLNQAYRRAYDDVGEISAEEVNTIGGEAYIDKYWAPYLKIANRCKTYSDCGYSSLTPFHYSDGTAAGNRVQSIDGFVVWFQTIDGFVYSIYYYKTSGDVASFSYVDITGGNGPNTFGKDVFILSRVIDGEKGGLVLPYGYNYSSIIVNAHCKKGGNNSSNCCAEKIRRAGWKIEKDYPW